MNAFIHSVIGRYAMDPGVGGHAATAGNLNDRIRAPASPLPWEARRLAIGGVSLKLRGCTDDSCHDLPVRCPPWVWCWAAIAYFMNRTLREVLRQASPLMEIVIMAVIGVINGVLGTPNAMLGSLFMTFSGSYVLPRLPPPSAAASTSPPRSAAYIIRKPGAATLVREP